MKFGYLRQDNDCHWYCVPQEEIEKFDKLLTKLSTDKPFYEMTKRESNIYFKNEDKFNADYGEYRLNGGFEDLKVLMEE